MVSVFCKGQPLPCRVLFNWYFIVFAISTLGLVLASQETDQDILSWVKTPQATALVKGDDLILACEVRHVNQHYSPSHPIITYSWTKDGGSIPPKASMYSNHSLFVPRIGEEDLGRYTCTVKTDNWDGEKIASANVIEAYLEPFIIQPKSQMIKVGGQFVLTCVTGKSAPQLEVYWVKDGQRFDGGVQRTAAFGDFDVEGLRLQTSMRLDIVASSGSSGIYQCVAWNKLLKSSVFSNPANVSLESVPSNLLPVIEWNVPETLVIAEGQNLTLGCKSQVSTEPVETNWFLGRYLVDESKRVYVLPDASLTFLPVSARDRGSYRCQASNSKGSTWSPSVELVIAYLLIAFQEEPSDTFALYGQNVVLNCQPPESLPKATVTWYKDYALFDTTSRPGTKIINSNLHLYSVTRSDIGSYYCIAFNRLTNPSSRTSRVSMLDIEGPPQMTQLPVRTRLLKGSLLHLQCLAESNPIPLVTWTFEGRSLMQDQEVTIMNYGQELWISNIGKAWEGEFSCNCSNKYGSISASTSVFIIVPPVSLHPIGVVNVTTGSPLIIPCPVDGFPTPSVQWYHNGTQISMTHEDNKKQLKWKVHGLDLVIDQVTPEFSGVYKCVASNEGGIVTSKGSLVVYVPPYFLEIPQTISATLGHEADLTCKAGGNHFPYIQWFLNNSLPVRGILRADNTTLNFPSLGWDHVGLYTCVATNGVGVVKRTASVSVLVPPFIVSTNKPKSPVKIKSRFVLSCGANGIPTPTIKWTHQDVPILPSLNGRVRFPMMGMLVVESAVEEDAGIYKCIAESEAGRDSVLFSVSIYGRPHPPTLLAAVPLSSTSVYLLWEWVTDGFRVSKSVDFFRIFYRKRSSEDVEIYPDLFPSNVTRVEVMSLDPGISYVFYIKAVNEVGTSEASNLLTAVTFHAAPSAPVNLKVLDLQPKSIVVTWEPPAIPNGVVKLYQLRYKRNDIADAYLTINITSPTFPTQEVTLQPLRPFFNYTIQARAATLHESEKLWGNFSSPLMVQTKMTVPSLPPQSVRVKPIDANSISVTWEPVPDLGKNGPLTGYIIICLDNQKNMVASHRVGKSFARKSVYGLLPWRQYWVTVKGENPVGIGPESKSVSAKTLPISPVTTPQEFTAMASSSKTIVLSWKPLPPESITCEITAYLVRYKQKMDNDWLTLSIPSNTTSHAVVDLLPWTLYEFSIASFTDTVSLGLGPYTESIFASTLQGESSPVTALAFTSHSTSVWLSWKPPLDVKGNLIGYSIYYQIVFVDRTSKSVDTSGNSTTCHLIGLLPNTTYNISVAPRNGAGNGQATILLVRTLLLIQRTEILSTVTVDNIANITSVTSAISLQEDSEQNHVKKNLASIVAGSIIGIIAFIIIVIFICAQCKKYRKKQRLSYAYHAYFNRGYTTQVM